MPHPKHEKAVPSSLSSLLNFSAARFCFLYTAGLLVLTARRPEGIFRPQFFAEDGAVFFRDAYQLVWHQSLFLPHAGYYNFIPRLLAEIGTLCPLKQVPLFYTSVSLCVASLCLSWIYLPSFRSLISRDWVRLLLAVFFFLMPNQESLMKLSYLQWYVLLWLTLCCFMELPSRSVACIVLVMATLAACWTTAISFILLPVWLLKTIYAPHQKRKIINGAFIVAGLSASLFNYAAGPADVSQLHFSEIDLTTLIHGLSNAIAYKVVCASFLGSNVTHGLFKHGWYFVYLCCSLFLALLFFMGYRIRQQLAISLWTLVYIIVSSVSCFMLRPSFVSSFVDGTNVRVHGRYFFLATCMFYVLTFVVGSEYENQLRTSGVKRAGIASLIMLFTVFHLTSFRMPHTTYYDLHWNQYAVLIKRMEQEATREQKAKLLVIPINPEPWIIELQIIPARNAP